MLNKLRRKTMLFWERKYLDFQLPKLIKNLSVYFEQAIYENKSKKVLISKPIFIVGCHRSGTTILHEMLAHHPDLAFFTNASSYSPKSPICANLIANIMLGDEKIERFVKDGMQVSCNFPSEGIRLWECYATDGDTYCLDESYDNPEMEHYLKLTIQKHLRYFDADRFINKNLDNSARIRYLNKLFPDAYFIHIIRDPRAVCQSLLKFRQAAANFFGAEHRHATSGVKSRTWSEIRPFWDCDPISSIGLLWRDVIETVEASRQFIAPEQDLELRYEDFAGNPRTHLENTVQFCQLSWNKDIERLFTQAAGNVSLCDRNDVWKQRFSPQEIAKLTAIVDSKMHQYGYALDCPQADCEQFSSATLKSQIHEIPKSVATHS
jgi:omega-hydroxy-beta-dihydromenaquinone-9 sulfotransferase